MIIACPSHVWSEIKDWIDRANRLVPAQDRKILLCPPRLVARFSKFALHRHAGLAGEASADDVSARDPELLVLIGELWRVLAKYYFRFRVEGLDNVPEHGPVLFVGNHCGGFLPSEGFFTFLAVHDHFGPERAMYALGHDFLFEDPVLRRYAGRLGILRAGHSSAHHAFAAGACVLVYPGSDFDTFRPFRDRHKIVLGGRKGFIKLALRERVPIVPVVTVGTHEQFIVLSRGDHLARWFHVRKWERAEVVPIVLSVPWGLTSGFMPYLPLPAQTTMAFAPPLSWPELGPDAADDPEALERCYREVETVMQRELDRISAGRHFLRGQRYPSAQPLREIPPHMLEHQGVDLAASTTNQRGTS